MQVCLYFVNLVLEDYENYNFWHTPDMIERRSMYPHRFPPIRNALLFLSCGHPGTASFTLPACGNELLAFSGRSSVHRGESKVACARFPDSDIAPAVLIVLLWKSSRPAFLAAKIMHKQEHEVPQQGGWVDFTEALCPALCWHFWGCG